jgi:uncharacterized membrane protein YadS
VVELGLVVVATVVVVAVVVVASVVVVVLWTVDVDERAVVLVAGGHALCGLFDQHGGAG